ncbi:MAG: hypothetical protein GQ467_01140, partial [Mariprofundaceae bacterium]|nr:hypothetical protein [Mariprofundaceae bacterium]
MAKTLLIRITNVAVELDDSDSDVAITLASALSVRPDQIERWITVRRALDARKKSHVHFVCTIECEVRETSRPKLPANANRVEHSVLDIARPRSLNRTGRNGEHVIVVGAGPAGLFA